MHIGLILKLFFYVVFSFVHSLMDIRCYAHYHSAIHVDRMDTINKHLTWAQQLCSQRECCVHDVRVRLRAKGAEPQEVEEVIAALIEQNFLNEARYARAFVHDKSKLQGWGPEKIRYALRAKQLPDALIRGALAEIDQDAQKERLIRLLEVKQQSIKVTSETDLRAKLIRFGLARGFTYNEAMAALSTLFAE